MMDPLAIWSRSWLKILDSIDPSFRISAKFYYGSRELSREARKIRYLLPRVKADFGFVKGSPEIIFVGLSRGSIAFAPVLLGITAVFDIDRF
jgi:hypothetical protein